MKSDTLSKQEQAQAQEQFLKLQEEYNKTGDHKILWEMEPLIRKACEANILKINKHHFVIDFDEKVDDAVFTILNRYHKNKDYHYNTLATLTHWAAIGASWSAKRKQLDLQKSFEQQFEELGLHEDHILYESMNRETYPIVIDGVTYTLEELT